MEIHIGHNLKLADPPRLIIINFFVKKQISVWVVYVWARMQTTQTDSRTTEVVLQ